MLLNSSNAMCGHSMHQQEQYIFINDAILEAVTCGDTQITASDLRRVIQKMNQREPSTRLTGLDWTGKPV